MYIDKNNRFFQILLVLILSCLVYAYVIFVEHSILLQDFSFMKFIGYFSFKKFLLILFVFSIVFYIYFDDYKKEKVLSFIYSYRIPLLFLILIVCVIFQIHGSSINELNFFNIKHNLLFGVSREIRADEFNVNTMLAFSQYINNFSYFGDIVRAVPTDMFLVYGQPVWDIGMIFKPFLIGYLFLNPGQGLSFFWVSRLLVLLLVSFEFGRLLANDNKKLALAYSLLITFSPLIQWWFAINGLVEQLIFGQLGVLLIYFYMKTTDYRKRLLIGLAMVIVVGGFGFVLYPSWQIPFAYVFAMLAVWIFLKHRHEFSYGKKDFIIILLSFAILTVLMAHILTTSLETIKIYLNTAYPGNEVFNGMGVATYFFNYVPSIFFSVMPDNIPLNVVDTSAFCDFFPVPLILAFIVLAYQKTKDKLLYGLLALYFIMVIFYFVPLPDFILDITLRGHVRNIRLYSVIGFLGILILIRSIASLKELKPKKLIVMSSFILSLIIVYLSTFSYQGYYMTWMLVILIVFYTAFISIIFMSSSTKGKKIFFIACIVLAFLTGALVNPVDHGTDVVYESNYIHEVENIVHSNPNGVWVVQDLYFNSLLPVGAKTVNSVNTYPDLDKWHSLDSSHQYENVYNRYAHIAIILQNGSETQFALMSPDFIHVLLNVNDLHKLNVSYFATPNDLEKFSNENVTFVKIYSEGPYKIYNVKYYS